MLIKGICDSIRKKKMYFGFLGFFLWEVWCGDGICRLFFVGFGIWDLGFVIWNFVLGVERFLWEEFFWKFFVCACVCIKHIKHNFLDPIFIALFTIIPSLITSQVTYGFFLFQLSLS